MNGEERATGAASWKYIPPVTDGINVAVRPGQGDNGWVLKLRGWRRSSFTGGRIPRSRLPGGKPKWLKDSAARVGVQGFSRIAGRLKLDQVRNTYSTFRIISYSTKHARKQLPQ